MMTKTFGETFSEKTIVMRAKIPMRNEAFQNLSERTATGSKKRNTAVRMRSEKMFLSREAT
jgi:hypothetical protein